MPVQKTQSSLFILDNRKFTTFYLKDNNGKLWVVSSDYCFFSGCSYLVTIDPVLTESNNDLILTCWNSNFTFCRTKIFIVFERINKSNCDYLCWQILNLAYPPKIPSEKNTCQIFLPPPPPQKKKKKIWNRKFQTQKILQSSLSLEIWSTPPGVELYYAFFIWKA